MKKCLILLVLIISLWITSSAENEKDPQILIKSLLNCHDSLKSSIYCDLAYYYIDSTGNKSLVFAEKALSYAEIFENQNDIIYSYIMIGSSYLTKSDYLKSLEAFLKADKLSENSTNFIQLHTISNNIGIAYRFAGDYELALKYYSKALNYARQSNDLQSIVQSLTNTGNIYVLQEQHKLGLKYYEAAINECQKQNKFIPDIPSIYNNIGYIYFIMNNIPEAKKAYTRAYEIFDSLNNDYGTAVLLNNLAELEIRIGNFDIAEKMINQADSLHRLMDFQESRKNLYFTSYELFLSKKDYPRAIEFLNKYNLLKDSIYNLELDKTVEEIKTKFEVERINNESTVKDEKIKQKNNLAIILLSVILLISILLLLLYKLIHAKVKLNTLLKTNNEILKLKEEEINANLQYARQIQIACMNNIQTQESTQYFILDLPKSTVGGDFYMIRKIVDETVFVLADCTGHGISGGFLSVLGLELLSHSFNQFTNLCSSINYLNNSYFKHITRSETLRQESLSLSMISVKDKEITYVGSKQKIWHYSKLLDELVELKTSEYTIGTEEHCEFTSNQLIVEIGDWIFLSSDGYADQFGGDIRKKLKYESFRKHLKHCTGMNPEDAKKYLYNEHLEWKKEAEQTDDILVIGIKF
jgi:serine phosphatase RsbU (regulator of sigma subunit)/Tfp pilus assembly protein PilF